MIAEVASELRAIARGANDASGYFPAMYSRVTGQIAASIARGDFEDGPRLDALATTFASYYTRAWRHEIPTPQCWRASWGVVTDTGLLILQHLLLGINAHVNHDLPQAVVNVARPSGSLMGIRRDFEVVNDILALEYGGILRDLDRVSRWANEAAALGGGRAFNFSLRVARSQAWSAAERLYPLGDSAREAYVAELDRLVSLLAYLITRPGPVASVLVRLARRLEERDVTVIGALLGDG